MNVVKLLADEEKDCLKLRQANCCIAWLQDAERLKAALGLRQICQIEFGYIEENEADKPHKSSSCKGEPFLKPGACVSLTYEAFAAIFKPIQGQA